MKRRLLMLGARTLIWLAGRAPLRCNRRIMRVLGRMVYPFLAGERRKVLRTLAQAAAPFRVTDPNRFAQRVLVNFGKMALDTASALRRWPEAIDELVEPESLRDFERTIKTLHRTSGRILYVTCHLGNWEIFGGIISRMLPFAAVAKRIRSPEYQVLVEGMRRRLGFNVFYQDSPLRGMLRFLKDGGTLALLPDQDIRRNAGVFVPFFGRSAYSPLGPAHLAISTQTPVLPIAMPHNGEGYRTIAYKPIFPPRERSEGNLIRFTALCQQAIERIVAEYPEQWAWFHPRYRTRPCDVEPKHPGPAEEGLG